MNIGPSMRRCLNCTEITEGVLCARCVARHPGRVYADPTTLAAWTLRMRQRIKLLETLQRAIRMNTYVSPQRVHAVTGKNQRCDTCNKFMDDHYWMAKPKDPNSPPICEQPKPDMNDYSWG